MLAGTPGYRDRGMFREYPPLDEQTILLMVELLLILGALFLLDITTTQVILRMGGAELNPLMAGVVANPALHLVVKAATLLLFPVSLIAEQRVKGSGLPFYSALILLYSAVVLHNLLFFVPQIII
jgi:hypothetical protein